MTIKKYLIAAGILIAGLLIFAFIANAASVFNVNQGGTGLGSVTNGDVFYGSTTNQSLVKLPIGTAGKILQSNGTVPTWVATSTLGLMPLSTGTLGYVTRWVSNTQLGIGILLDNGIVAGVNATSSAVTFNVQGTAGAYNPFNVASSSGTSYLHVTQGGIVGIGTTNPTDVNANAHLTVAGAGSQDIIASTTDNTTLSDAILQAYAPGSRIFMGAHGTNQVSVRYGITLGGWGEIGAFNSTSGSTNGMIIGTNPAVPIVFGTTNIERMRILSGGNIGIGSTSPQALLVVQGSAVISGGLNLPTQTPNTILGVDTNKNVVSNALVGGANITITTTTPGLMVIAGSAGGGTASGTPGNIQFAGAAGAFSANNLFTWYQPSNRLMINTTTLNATLGIQASSTAQTAPIFRIASTTADSFSDQQTIFTVLPTGNIGIGTSTPGATLNIQQQGANPSFIISTSSGVNIFSVNSNTSANNMIDIQQLLRSGTHGSGVVLYVTGSVQTDTGLLELRHTNGTQGLSFGYTGMKANGSNTNQDFTILTKGNGKLGLGTTTGPSAINIQPTGASVNPILDISSSTGISVFRIDGIGNVGINSTSPISRFVIQGSSTQSYPLLTVSSSSSASLFQIDQNGLMIHQPTATSSTAVLWKNPAGATVFQVDETQSNAGLSIGTTSTASTLIIQSNTATAATFIVASSTGGIELFRVNSNGGVFATSTLNSGASQTYYWCADTAGQLIKVNTTCLVSARKFKKDIKPLDIGLNELLKLVPVTYYNKDEIFGATQQIGFIADDVEKVDKRLITYDNKGDIHGFNYEQFTAWLTKAAQEVEVQIQNIFKKNDEQDKRIQKLEQENVNLKIRLDALEKKLK